MNGARVIWPLSARITDPSWPCHPSAKPHKQRGYWRGKILCGALDPPDAISGIEIEMYTGEYSEGSSSNCDAHRSMQIRLNGCRAYSFEFLPLLSLTRW